MTNVEKYILLIGPIICIHISFSVAFFFGLSKQLKFIISVKPNVPVKPSRLNYVPSRIVSNFVLLYISDSASKVAFGQV